MNKKPNIVFIMTDQQRQDTLGCYGNTLIDTPCLDKLALEGVVLDHFYVNNPVCVPSRCSFLTGRYPNAHRSRDLQYALDSRERHLFRILQGEGYRLGLCGKNHAMRPSDLDHFDFVYEHGTYQKAKVPGEKKAYSSAVDPTALEQYSTNLLSEQAVLFLEKFSDQPNPFCLWLSFPDPHTPYQVPEPYASLVNPKHIPAPVEMRLDSSKQLSQQLIHQSQGMADAAEEEIKQTIAVYHGMIALLDKAIGKVLDKISELGLDDETIIVFTSDHGEYMGDHGMIRKSLHFYDCLLKVPFIFRWKAKIKPNRVSDTMVEAVDLLPTLLELAEIPLPEEIQGKSLAALLYGKTEDHKKSVYAAAGNPGETLKAASVSDYHAVKAGPLWEIGAIQGCMVRTMEWKYCSYVNGEGELYNLLHDPHETKNLINRPDCISEQTNMMQLLIQTMMLAEDPRRPDSGTWKANK